MRELQWSVTRWYSTEREQTSCSREQMPQNRDTQHEILLFLGSNETTVNLESSPVLRVHFILKSHSILSWLVSVVKYLHKAHTPRMRC